VTPSVEHAFNGIDHILQFGEVSIMSSFSPCDFPNPLNRIEFRAVGRLKLQRKFLAIQSPFSMKLSVVVSDVVDDQHNTPSRVRADLAQVSEESEKCLPVELVCSANISSSNNSLYCFNDADPRGNQCVSNKFLHSFAQSRVGSCGFTRKFHHINHFKKKP
jgi:hypothetical protein